MKSNNSLTVDGDNESEVGKLLQDESGTKLDIQALRQKAWVVCSL